MFVRTAGNRDLAAIRALLVETWHATYDAIYGVERVTAITEEWHSIAALKARLTKPNSEFLVADDGKRIGGVAFAESVDGGDLVVLKQLYVLPTLQGRGIGGMLLDEVIECFPEARAVRLEVEKRNTHAIAFYEANGFVRSGDAGERARATGEATLVYHRPLAG
ncbi:MULTISPECIES: GNAT family N-acetyltransferase [unclassified Mesorhizobium]|uniref:GNAT family N-acetyltransferase n=1 Tax=unclassified Mesorhizobium TaxID=325217 RepID=UPI00112B498C|nr:MULTISPECIES: GNAT family N-acetyltransferase [unclassified Mesorhizobium]TPN48758.1 GNAT family N-acetyltransferase [Mesorhizobium sp. B1-1-7]TPN48870.1 GNAT family N-acetyltransferase [Mesorhizobium sp. B1-1-9]